MSNWSAGTSGTVWIGMVCAGAAPATARRTIERDTTRLVMRHLVRWGSPDTEDTRHTVRRVTGRCVVALVWSPRNRALGPSLALRGALRRIHPQQPIDRALPRPRGLERADRDHRAGDQPPIAFVHGGQPRVEHRQDQQGVAERRRAIFEPAHREQNPDVHHRRAHDPGEEPERLEEAVERRETADDRERTGHLARARIERADVDPSLRHMTPPLESLFYYMAPGRDKVALARFAR